MSTANLPYILHPLHVKKLVKEWLMEDTPNFDYGGFVVGETEETAIILCKDTGVLAGVPFVNEIFNVLDCRVEWTKEEGVFIGEPIKIVARVTGKVRHLLLGERLALNCISRASGIATLARRLNTVARDAGWHGEIAGTRKTTPGFRMVEKYALLVGGISSHRYDLSAMVMLKDNHIWAAGNITQAVKDARRVCGFSAKIEVECRSTEEAAMAAEAGADIVMLDNFHPQALHEAAQQVKKAFPKVLIEASGGVSEKTLTQYFGKDIDVISLSSTTQGYQVVDFSMKIVKDNKDPSNPLVQI